MLRFGKPKSKADAALRVMDEMVSRAADKWRYFFDNVPYHAEIGLADRISAFSVPFNEGARTHIPELRHAPDGLLLMIVALGVEKSGTHSRNEIERALRVSLP